MKHNFWKALFHFLHSHSKPVVLCALPSFNQLEAAEFQDVEKTVAHHVGDGVITIEKALFKSNRDREIKDRNKYDLHDSVKNLSFVSQCQLTIPLNTFSVYLLLCIWDFAFIQSNFQCIHFISNCVPWESTTKFTLQRNSGNILPHLNKCMVAS